jgi:SAM-dependent methyltransferase
VPRTSDDPGSSGDVDRIPEDPAARAEWIERWAAEQQRRIDARVLPLRRRIRLALALRPEQFKRVGWWTNRVRDRGINTAGPLLLPEHSKGDRQCYVPSAWHVLPRALRYVGVSDRDTFVDFGCGKGRVVHQAARRRFRRVIGVELSPRLADMAREAVAAQSHRHRCRDVEIVVGNAAEFTVPDDMTIAYLFDPFGGEELDAVLTNIIASIDRHPRPVTLIYVRPRQPERILATGRFRLVKELRGGLRDRPLSRASIFASR